MHGWYGAGWGGWLLMMVMFVLFWSAIVGLAVYGIYLVRRPAASGRPEPERPAHHDAERILAERFARGEIDEDEFLARRATLRRS
ncbi:MAG: SHOCT domain-containing protein [Rhodococcus sp. (in: high G+C Gram-positive bacteria)]|uniref:Putative membrane protein n=1 Tax=Rhodococcus rhodochrous J45 TaxID=935266 RepID=A0A562E311_RHORH|nr:MULTISPECIES: SHOCT domain-containing protein [Rhodococcus]TWH16415.1 putative membrane protein [Rhodococcus rhodochrous J45]BDB60713.1 membrane protein [Rhodococcus sp. RDE2]